jgi:hypothetical protein
VSILPIRGSKNDFAYSLLCRFSPSLSLIHITPESLQRVGGFPDFSISDFLLTTSYPQLITY